MRRTERVPCCLPREDRKTWKMDWMRRQDVKEESPETPTALTPDETDECYFEEDTSIDEGMVRDLYGY